MLLLLLWLFVYRLITLMIDSLIVLLVVRYLVQYWSVTSLQKINAAAAPLVDPMLDTLERRSIKLLGSSMPDNWKLTLWILLLELFCLVLAMLPFRVLSMS